MKKTVCKIDMCTGCKACFESCPEDALRFDDSVRALNVVIDSDRCISCGLCHNVCQVNNPVDLLRPFFWKQGWAEVDVRINSSSGGFATQLMKQFVNDNSYVCSCRFQRGNFGYHITNNIDDIDSFKGSKYVKSNPQGIYKKIRELLKAGKRVLFIGLPCHVAALKKYIGSKQTDSLFTVDLICHGSPSPEILKAFLSEYKYEFNNIQDIKFRNKGTFDVFLNAKSLTPIGSLDRYTIGFLKGLFYTENCYSCRYAKLDRASDITIGDSWGTDLKEEESEGVSLALCQTEKGKGLLLRSGLNLYDVDLNRAVTANHQLRHPSERIPEREKFFQIFAKTRHVGGSVFLCFPKECIKQSLKGILIKMHIKKKGGNQYLLRVILNN